MNAEAANGPVFSAFVASLRFKGMRLLVAASPRCAVSQNCILRPAGTYSGLEFPTLCRLQIGYLELNADESEHSAHRPCNHQFFVRADDANRDPAGAELFGQAALGHKVVARLGDSRRRSISSASLLPC